MGDELGQYQGIGGLDSRDGINMPTPLTYAYLSIDNVHTNHAIDVSYITAVNVLQCIRGLYFVHVHLHLSLMILDICG